MMRFEIRALAGNAVVQLALDASDARAATQQAHAQGYTVLSVVERRQRMRRRDSFSLILFTQELVALLAAGLGLVEAIQALAERQSGAGARAVLTGVLQELRNGKPLSAALRAHSAIFPALYIETVRASERTGALPEALARFVAFQSQVDEIRQKLVSALIYPVLLMVVGALVTLFLLGYVVPRFSGIYADMGHELPFASRWLFALGGLIDRHAALAAIMLAAAVVAGVLAARSGALPLHLARALVRVPLLGERIGVYRLTRLYRTTSMLLRGGIPLASALEMVGGLLDTASRARLERATRQVREGGSLSAALVQNALATPIAARMLQVGERSGDLGGLMERAAAFHEEELGRWVERSTRLFEPLLMMMIGLLIGAIVVLMYMPIFDLAGSLQ